MTARTRKYLWIGGGSVAGLLLLLVAGAFVIIQTNSFQQLVRRRIIEAVESSTGGKVDLAEFHFDVRHRRATLRDFVLHGSESGNEEPLFRANAIGVEIKLLQAIRGVVGISALDVDQPRVNLIVFPDGRTNIPRPGIPKQPGDKNQLETLVDLAVGRFRLNDGNFRFRELSIPFSARGENLHAELAYEHLVERYRGGVTFDPLLVQTGENPALKVTGNLPVVIGKDHIELLGATLVSPQSRVELTGSIENFASPRANVNIQGQIDVPEVAASLGQPLSTSASAPRVLTINLTGDMNDKRLAVTSAALSLGQSSLAASGEFQNATFENGALNLRGKFVVNELVRLLKTAPQAAGTLDLAGQLRVRSRSDYAMDATLTGRGLSYRQGNVRVTGAALTSTILVDPNLVRVDPLRIDAAGGRITGRGNLRNWNRYQVSSNLSGFQLQQILASAGTPGSAWGASISGRLGAEGELDGIRLRSARTNLSIVPNGRGIPLRGL